MKEVAQLPFFGQGYGSRIVVGDEANAFILDNQVLGILMEAGALGVAGYAVFMLAPVVMLLVFALRFAAEPRHASARAVARAIAIAGYSTALFFFDAFGFFQSFLVHMMLLAVAAWVYTEAPRRADGCHHREPIAIDGGGGGRRDRAPERRHPCTRRERGDRPDSSARSRPTRAAPRSRSSCPPTDAAMTPRRARRRIGVCASSRCRRHRRSPH